MRLVFSTAACVIGCLSSFLISCITPALSDEPKYTPWGLDEYQLLGLTKHELSTKFKGKLFFSNDFNRATFFQNGTGLGYQGPLFKLSFSDGRVSLVRGVFEGCQQNFERSRFDSKEVALNYAIQGLSCYDGPEEQKSLDRAKHALTELKSASMVKKAHTRDPF